MKLSAEVTSQVEPRLASCPACRGWLAKKHREKPQAATRALDRGRLTAANKAVQSDETSPSLSEALLALR